jgi:2'-5' RNA ligase
MAFEAGQSAVIVVVPEVEPVVGWWRAAHDLAAAVGVPAHVTIVYPFLPEDRLDEAAVRQVVAGHPPFTVVFARVGRFPGVVHLEPEPGGPFRDLTGALVRRWPEAPPYGGVFDEVVPHLTVAHDAPEEALEAAERDVAMRLPVTAVVEAVRLIVFDGERWRHRATLPLGRPRGVCRPAPGVHDER